MIRNLLFISILLFLFTSCRKNEDSTIIDTTVEEVAATFLTVMVRNQENEPVSNAAVDIFSENDAVVSMTTNEEGRAVFDVTEFVFHEKEFVFIAQHDAYINGLKRVKISDLGSDQIAIQIIKTDAAPFPFDFTPFPLTDNMVWVTGSVLLPDGNGAEAFVLLFENQDPGLSNFDFITTTDEFGNYELLVPVNTPLLYTVIGACGAVNEVDNPGIPPYFLDLQEIGPFTSNTELPTLIDEGSNSAITITGQAVDGSGFPLGVVFYEIIMEVNGEIFNFFETSDQSGFFEFTTNTCGAVNFVTIQVTDLNNGLTSSVITVLDISNMISLGEIPLNEQPAGNYFFEITFNSGLTFSTINTQALVTPDIIEIRSIPGTTQNHELIFPNAEIGISSLVESFIFFDETEDLLYFNSNISVEVAEISNEFVSGTFSGLVLNVNTGDVEEATGSFSSPR